MLGAYRLFFSFSCFQILDPAADSATIIVVQEQGDSAAKHA
jgi:hypothetical protein